MDAQVKRLVAEAERIAKRAEALGDEGELYIYLFGKVQGLLDAASILGSEY